jgi:hypothetical protein
MSGYKTNTQKSMYEMQLYILAMNILKKVKKIIPLRIVSKSKILRNKFIKRCRRHLILTGKLIYIHINIRRRHLI